MDTNERLERLRGLLYEPPSAEVWDQLCAYDRRDFHPDDFDTDELVETWREELFGDAGSLTPLLADTGS